MTYDGFVLAAVVAELEKTILGGAVQKVRQHNATDLTLEIRAPGRSHLLFFSVDARFPRVYLAASSPPVPPEPPNFCMVARKYTVGALITGVEQVGMDRVIKIHTESSEHGRCTLILEIMGKHSNLILTNSEGKILGAAKHVGSTISRYRQVLPGRDYMPPPGVEKVDLRGIDAASFERLWPLVDDADPTETRKALMETFSGFGPFLADEIIARSTEGDFAAKTIVQREILALGEMARTASFEPVFITDAAGHGLVVYPMPSVQFPIDRQHPRASVNEALDALFRSLVTRSVLEDERAQTLTAVRRATAARKQTLKSIDRTLAESTKADRYRQIGELILANLPSIPRGVKSASLIDYYDPEMPTIDIDLDEKLEPQQNAERYFKRYQKARDAAVTAQGRRVSVDRELAILTAAAAEAESEKSAESLKALRKMLADQDLLRAEVVHEKGAEPEFAGFRIRRTYTPEGWEILYGENSLSNDHLTQRVARPNDVWLHARSVTGAHVVIRTAGQKANVPVGVLAQAARIAARNSDARHSSLVPVDHTLRKFVRKPRGSAPGLVTYRNEKTIDINPAAK